MEKLNILFQSIISTQLKVKSIEVKDLKIVSSYDYSDLLFQEIAEVLPPSAIAFLQKTNIQIGLNPLDEVFICDFKMSSKDYRAVIYNYHELYLPTFAWHIIEL